MHISCLPQIKNAKRESEGVPPVLFSGRLKTDVSVHIYLQYNDVAGSGRKCVFQTLYNHR